MAVNTDGQPAATVLINRCLHVHVPAPQLWATIVCVATGTGASRLAPALYRVKAERRHKRRLPYLESKGQDTYSSPRVKHSASNAKEGSSSLSRDTKPILHTEEKAEPTQKKSGRGQKQFR